jgi:hypothetical protein
MLRQGDGVPPFPLHDAAHPGAMTATSLCTEH